MMKRLLLSVFALAVMASGAGVALGGQAAYAAPKDDICSGIGATGGTTGCKASGPTLTSIVRSAVSTLSVIAGIAAIIMMLISGFRYITAGGDASKIKGAQSTLTYALVGLLITALAQTLVHFVLSTTVPSCPVGNTSGKLSDGTTCRVIEKNFR